MIASQKLLDSARTRYEAMRRECLKHADAHPDSNDVCHKSIGKCRTYPSITYHLAMLADDLFLATTQAAEVVRELEEQIETIRLLEVGPQMEWCEHLQAENEALRKDAERCRFIRQQHEMAGSYGVCFMDNGFIELIGSFNGTIDAALAAQTGGEV